MRYVKTLFISLVMLSAMTFTQFASAQTIGTVDADKIISNYTKAQDVEADLKVKEAEIQKFIAEAQKKIKDAATPVEKSNLEKQLGDEFKTKQNEFRNIQLEESKKINDFILSAIQSVAKGQKIDIVIAKGAVFVGGTDITDMVLKTLNAGSGK